METVYTLLYRLYCPWMPLVIPPYNMDSGEGYALPHTILCLDLAGYNLTDYLSYRFATIAENGTELDIEEKLYWMSVDFEEKMATIPPHSRKTTSSLMISWSSLVMKIGVSSCDIHEATLNSVIKCDVDKEKDLYVRPVLSDQTPTCPALLTKYRKESQPCTCKQKNESNCSTFQQMQTSKHFYECQSIHFLP